LINSHYDADPARYHALRDSWLNQRRARRFAEFVAPVAAGATVVEVGAGTGALLAGLAGERPDVNFVGLEPLANYVEFATQHAAGIPNVRFETGFAEQASGLVAGASVDRVLSSDVLHHVDDTVAVGRNLASVTRPGGQWLAIEPSWLNPYMFAFCALTKGERNFWPRRFRDAVAVAGWRVVAREYLFLIPSRVPDPPEWMRRAEARFEHLPVVSGGVALTLERSLST
jgi:2-polyprenyl-3-methyl-5-hydroxy-6-metoxy-1,4-benzoquinol methylase